VVDVRFVAGLVKEDERGKIEVHPNPQQRKALECLNGWRYRAYGEVTAVDPETTLDCGDVEVSLPDHGGDVFAVGDVVMVEILRLDCWRARG
jgi:hypothetical protein